MEFSGDFETHITVRLENPGRIQALREWGVRHRMKCLHIVLDRGATPSQPMLTRHGRGRLSDELDRALGFSQLLNESGFSVTRIKLEVAPWNEDVPKSDEEARRHPSERYFEHHIKLLLAPSADIASLASLAEAYSAHLSRNAMKTRTDGHQERFITQRCHAVGRIEAHRRLETLQSALATLEHPILEVEEEFVVYDSNLAVDAGWIRSTG